MGSAVIPEAVVGDTAPSTVVVVTSPVGTLTVVAPFSATVVIVPVVSTVGALANPKLLGAIDPSVTALAILVLTVAGSTPAAVSCSLVKVPELAAPNNSGSVMPTANNAAPPMVAHPPGML